MSTNIDQKPRIAVIGSGIAGLSAAWALRETHAVTIFEKADRLGMGQKGLTIDDGSPNGLRLDIPLRVFNSRYYPSLFKLCQHLNVSVRMLDNDSSFSNSSGQTYFRYHNLRIFNASFSYIKPRIRSLKWTACFLRDYFRFSSDIKAKFHEKLATEWTLAQYLDERGFRKEFSSQFLLPFVSAICTCSLEEASLYPAAMILRLFESFLVSEPMRRWMGGTSELENALSRDLQDIRLNSPVKSIIERDDAIEVVTNENQSIKFNHVILALQADQSAHLLRDVRPQEAQLLSQIPYSTVSVAIHGDRSLLPSSSKDWATVNYQLTSSCQYPRASIWLNRGELDFKHYKEPLFQTLNPPDQLRHEIKRVNFKRSLVTRDSLKAVKELIRRQAELDLTKPNILLCGAYMEEKVPLLENGLISSLRLARGLGAQIPKEIWIPG